MPIRILSPEIASRIAAGEVVERPASVVKELVENGLDAGAHTIHIEAIEGGSRLLRVLDDGCGIPPAEVELAFARHSTSKLSGAEDLERIHTLGFRGEALAAIAAVSQVTLISRTSDQDLGAMVRLEGGETIHREGRGHPPGTVITIENLFYNTPARRKFLRTASTERRHITRLVECYALAYPEVRFTLIHDGRLVFQTTGQGNLRDVCIQSYGLETARELLPLKGDEEATIRINGLVSPPAVHRATRSQLTFFVNRRWIQDRMLAYGVEQAYHTLLPTGRHPIAVVGLTMDPAQIDVNIHPTKSEVRFRDSNAVFRAVQRVVRSTLMGKSPVPHMRLTPQQAIHSMEAQRWETLRRKELNSVEQLPLIPHRSEVRDEYQRLPPLRVVGQVSQAYIIAEGPGGMFLIDQHAAHERVLYEQFRAQQKSSGTVSQGILAPQTVELTPEQEAILGEYNDELGHLGFDLEPFGGQTVLIRALPAPFQRGDPAQVLVGVLDDLSSESASPLRDPESRLIATVCKRAAIKAGQTLSTEEMRALIHQLEQTEMPRTCPHGRPTMIHLSQIQLEREFGRG